MFYRTSAVEYLLGDMLNFPRMPSLGGWLSILNCAFFLAFVVADRLGVKVEVPTGYSLQLFVMLFMSLPFAWALLMPQLDYSPTRIEVAFNLVLLGCNSFLWGYGLAAIVKQVRRLTIRSS